MKEEKRACLNKENHFIDSPEKLLNLAKEIGKSIQKTKNKVDRKCDCWLDNDTCKCEE